MAKPKAKQNDRHKPNRMIRVRERIARQAEQLAKSRETDLTQVVNDLIIESLERRGLWPPKA